MGVPLGVLNALVNLVIWTTHAVVTRFSESVYARASAWEVKAKGRTASTDAAEIAPASLLLGGAGPVLRRGRAWWVSGLILCLALLVPLELLVESGIESRARCSPRVVRNSTGVCAQKWAGHSTANIAAASLLVQRADWADKDWDVVLEGSRKDPRVAEVRTKAALKRGRRVLAADCIASVVPCTAACGAFTVEGSNGAFDTIVTKASAAGPAVGFGDVAYDKAIMLAFYFWPGRSLSEPAPGRPSRRRIFARGVETLLTKTETDRVLSNPPAPWTLSVGGRANARMYNISCVTDGLPASNLSTALSLFRTSQIEGPGSRRLEARSAIGKLPKLSGSDVAKAAFAMSASDWSPDCAGDVDVYTECGGFSALFVAPFFALAAVLFLVWLAVRVVLRRVSPLVPMDAKSWRRKAHEMAGALRGSRHGGDSHTALESGFGTRGMPGERIDRPGGEAIYDPSAFSVAITRGTLTPPAVYLPVDFGGPPVGAVLTPPSYILPPRFEADR